MLKVTINYILWRLGLRDILPKEYINKVIVKENNEPLVLVKETSHLKISKDCPKLQRVRLSVAKHLETASENLPEGYTLILFEGFRSLERQKYLWDSQYEKIKKENPNLSQEETERQTRLFVAKPDINSCGHITGGAVDITLGDKNGNELFLGTNMHEFSPATQTNAKCIGEEIRNLRAILLLAMQSAGFVNYPGEWWHFSCGDKLWSAYSHREECDYGSVGE